jgi:hypothetical protein
MMARRGDVLLKPALSTAFCIEGIRYVHQQSHAAPGLVLIETVQ